MRSYKPSNILQKLYWSYLNKNIHGNLREGTREREGEREKESGGGREKMRRVEDRIAVRYCEKLRKID